MKRYEKLTEGIKLHKPLYESEVKDDGVCPNCGQINWYAGDFNKALADDTLRCQFCGYIDKKSEFEKAVRSGQKEITVEK